MAGKINANQTNKVVLYATLPPNNVNDSVFVDMVSHYDQREYRNVLAVEQKGDWIVGNLAANHVPVYDDFYDVSVRSAVGGNTTWANELRSWSDIEESWAAIEGIVRGILIANSIFEVDGNEDYSSKEYLSDNSDFNQKEYVSDSEDVSETEYISSVETSKSKSYK